MFTEMHFKEKQRFNFISGCIESLLLRGYFAFVCNDSSVYIAKSKNLFVRLPYTTKINIFNLPAGDSLAVTSHFFYAVSKFVVYKYG